MGTMAEYVTHMGKWDVAARVTDGRTFEEQREEYLGGLDSDYRALLDDTLDRLDAHATPAFREMRLARLGVGMPVGFQEDRYVGRALDQYAGQRKAPPHRIVGYLNWYEDASEHVISSTRAILDRFIDYHPQVPFAYFEDVEPEPFLIVRARKRITDTLLSLVSGRAMIAGHDADMAWLNPTHFKNIDDTVTASPYPVVSVTPFVSHERTPELSNMDLVINWFDDEEDQELTGKYFEPGPAFDAGAYMAIHGYDLSRKVGATIDILTRIHQGNSKIHPARLWTPQAKMVLSPRRLYDALFQGRGYSEFWDGEGIRNDDDYRDRAPESFAWLHDISEQRRDNMLRQYGAATLRSAINYHAQLPSFRDFNPGMIAAYCRDRFVAVRERLGGPEDMFDRAA